MKRQKYAAELEIAKVTREFIKIRPHNERPTIPHVHVHDNADSANRDRIRQRVLRGFESLLRLKLLLQCEQNWKCQIRLLPRLCICAHVWLLLYVYTHMYTSYLYRVVGLMAPRVIIFQASVYQVNGIFIFSVLNVIGTT